MKYNKYAISNLDKDTLRILTRALELYIRLSTGELDEVDRAMVWDFGRSNTDTEGKKAVLQHLKNMYFPDLIKGGYYSITSSKVPEQVKIMYDLYYSIRHEIDAESPLGKASAYRADPLNIANKPLPSIMKE